MKRGREGEAAAHRGKLASWGTWFRAPGRTICTHGCRVTSGKSRKGDRGKGYAALGSAFIGRGKGVGVEKGQKLKAV